MRSRSRLAACSRLQDTFTEMFFVFRDTFKSQSQDSTRHIQAEQHKLGDMLRHDTDRVLCLSMMKTLMFLTRRVQGREAFVLDHMAQSGK